MDNLKNLLIEMKISEKGRNWFFLGKRRKQHAIFDACELKSNKSNDVIKVIFQLSLVFDHEQDKL